MKHPPEPTPEQCSAGQRVADHDGKPAYACWYPQMGGYVGKCVVVMSEAIQKNDEDRCFDAFIWHNGDFPFRGEYESVVPHRIHHCMPSQFVNFGNFVIQKQHEHTREEQRPWN